MNGIELQFENFDTDQVPRVILLESDEERKISQSDKVPANNLRLNPQNNASQLLTSPHPSTDLSSLKIDRSIEQDILKARSAHSDISVKVVQSKKVNSVIRTIVGNETIPTGSSPDLSSRNNVPISTESVPSLSTNLNTLAGNLIDSGVRHSDEVTNSKESRRSRKRKRQKEAKERFKPNDH